MERFKKAVSILIIASVFGLLAGLLLARGLGGHVFLHQDIFITKIMGPYIVLFGVKISLLSMVGTMCFAPCVRNEKIARLRPWLCLTFLLISLISFLAM